MLDIGLLYKWYSMILKNLLILMIMTAVFMRMRMGIIIGVNVKMEKLVKEDGHNLSLRYKINKIFTNQ